MTSERPYRAAFTQAQAVAELTDKSGSQFDPSVVDALVRLLAAERTAAEQVVFVESADTKTAAPDGTAAE